MEIKNENDYLVYLIDCALHGKVPKPAEPDISLKKVFEAGKLHEVANVAYTALCRLEKQPEEDISKEWYEYYLLAVKRDALQKKASAEILEALHEKGIYTLEVQGTKVKKYYPESHLRMMSDIDIIIPPEKLTAAFEIMEKLGYETVFAHNDTEVQASKGSIFVELHSEFFPEYRNVSKALSDPFGRALLHDDFSAEVTDTDFYLFHLLHTIKHADEFMGVGIRRIIDLYYLEEAMKGKADFEYIDRTLKENGFIKTKEKLISVKNHWFCGGEASPKIIRYEKEILSSGNHGTEEILNKNSFAKEHSEGKRFVKLRYVMRFLFPPKEDIYKAYPVCEKRHYPAVLCHLHRAFASVFDKKKWANFRVYFSRLRYKVKSK